MTIEEVEVSSLSQDPANVRRHSPRNIEAVKSSLRRFGQQLPLVVDANNVVRVGNARLEAMTQLGWQTAKVVKTNLAGSELAAYGIADNRTGDADVGSTFDHSALAAILTALQAEDATLADAAGYSPDEIAALISTDQTPEQPTPPAAFPSFDESIQTDHECPKCKFRWSGSSAPQGEAA